MIGRNPSFDGDAAHVLVGRDEVELLCDLVLNHVERVPGRPGLVDDQDAGGALFSSDLVLVRPAAVVGHGATAECFWIELRWVRGVGHRRIVHQHDERLALDVHAFVVIPVVFGSDNAVADEHQIGIREAR